MTKMFEEELKDREAETFSYWDGCTISKKEFINYADVVNLSQGWVSPEEYEKLVKNCAVYVLECKNINRVNAQLTKENENLKSQLQQQALPVVPEFVGDYISGMKENGENIAFAIMCNIYNVAGEGNAKAIHWKDSNPEDFARAWLDGYTVEKPQLFYLCEKNTGYYLRKSGTDWYGITAHYSNDYDENYMNYKFTQKEIDNLDTGSYEKIEVEK